MISAENGFSYGLNHRISIIRKLQKLLSDIYSSVNYNVFCFGSFLTERFKEGKSDIDLAIYTPIVSDYIEISCTIEDFLKRKGIPSDIFYIDFRRIEPVYIAPLQYGVRFTDYYPAELKEFLEKCVDENDKDIRKAV